MSTPPGARLFIAVLVSEPMVPNGLIGAVACDLVSLIYFAKVFPEALPIIFGILYV